MKKIIVSSQAFSRMLEKFILNTLDYDKDDYFIFSTKGHTFSLGGLSLDVESKSDWELEFTFNKIREIKRVVKKIPHQPLVITFNDNGIEIEKICF